MGIKFYGREPFLRKKKTAVPHGRAVFSAAYSTFALSTTPAHLSQSVGWASILPSSR